MKLLHFIILLATFLGGGEASAQEWCFRMCQTHSLPEDICIEQRCRKEPLEPGVGSNIICRIANSPFRLSMKLGDVREGENWWEQSYHVSGITPFGPRLPGEGFTGIAIVSDYSTRVGVGYIIRIGIPGIGAKVSLKWINWTANDEIEPLGIRGSLIYEDGATSSLTCSSR